MLCEKENFMRLPLPMHVRRWLADERLGRLCRPAEGVLDPRRRSMSFHSDLENIPVEVTVQVNSVTAVNIKRISFDVDFTLMWPWLHERRAISRRFGPCRRVDVDFRGVSKAISGAFRWLAPVDLPQTVCSGWTGRTRQRWACP